MMITPEMMEQLGGKRGEARGPDMTNREISDADGQEDYGGAASLEEAVGDWEGGRKRKRKKAKAKMKQQVDRFGAAYAEFRAENDRLQATADSVRSYIGGLRQLCEGHERVAAEMKGALGQLDSLSEPVREYHERSSWCRTSDPHSQASHMQELMTTTVLEPIARHLETRRELEARLGKGKKKDHQALLDEVATHAESLPGVMNSPFEALRRCQIDFMALGAKLTGGQAGQDLGLGDIEVATAMTERGRGLTGKTGYTPRPTHEPEPEPPSEGIPPTAGAAEGVPPSGGQLVGPDVWSDVTAGSWRGPEVDLEGDQLGGPISGLALFGQFGWQDGQPSLFATLRNFSKVEISGVRVEVLQSDLQVACKRPLDVGTMAPGAEKRLCATLALGSAAAAGQPAKPAEPALEDDFDSFFAERDEALPLDTEQTEDKRSLDSWAVDPESASLKLSVKLSSSLLVTTVEMPFPYQLLLQGHSPLSWREFLELWSGPTRLPEPEPEPEPEEQQEPDDGTTKICVRIEDPPEILGYTRFDPDTMLDVVRQMLMADPKFNSKLPARWVFVKKGAPVGTKAEAKWRVAETVPNAVIRDKSRPLGDGEWPGPAASPGPGFAASPGGLMPVSSDSSGWAEAGLKEDGGDRDGGSVPESEFVASTRCTTDVSVVEALAVGGMTLVGRLEVGKTEVLLMFFARVAEDVHFLLQVTREEAADEASAGRCKCVLRGPKPELFATFECCVQALLSSRSGFVEVQRHLGGGEPYYGDWGGVSLEATQDGAGNDDGFEYCDFGELTVEQTVSDWLTRHAYGKLSDGTCAVLVEAGIEEGEWLQELIAIEQDGQLAAFMSSVAKHEERKQSSAKSGSSDAAEPAEAADTGYDYGDFGGVSLEDAMGGDDDGYDYGDYGGASLEDALAAGGGGDGGDEYDYGDYGGVSLEEAVVASDAGPIGSDAGADFAAFDSAQETSSSGRPPVSRHPGLSHQNSSRSLVSEANAADEAAFGTFEASFGDFEAEPAANLDSRLESGPESGVYDPDLVALAARSGQTWRPEHWAPYRPKEEAADAGRASWSSVYAARRGSADSGDSFDARSAGSAGTRSTRGSRPACEPGTPRRVSMAAGSGSVDALEALQAPAPSPAGSENGYDHDHPSLYDDVANASGKADTSSRGGSSNGSTPRFSGGLRGSPTVSDYD